MKVFPGYHPGYAGMGRAQAAKGDFKAAIASYEKAQASTPLPDYAAALYDLYTIQKDAKNAQRQLDMIDVIDQINKNNGEVTNRNVALIFADHDWHLDRALELATAELDVRRIFTATTPWPGLSIRTKNSPRPIRRWRKR